MSWTPHAHLPWVGWFLLQVRPALSRVLTAAVGGQGWNIKW